MVVVKIILVVQNIWLKLNNFKKLSVKNKNKIKEIAHNTIESYKSVVIKNVDFMPSEYSTRCDQVS
jgi:hypothetical protein